MTQLRQRKSDLDQLDIRVKVVTFDADYRAITYINMTDLQWPLLLDEDQQLYDSFGLDRGSWWAIWHPRSIWKYLKLMAKGQNPGKPGKDWRQLGGDVLIDPVGIVRLHHVSSDPHDRPCVESILAIAMEQA